MDYKIILIINNKTKARVCEEYCYKSILLDKCIIKIGQELKIVYKNNSYFKHYELVQSIEPFEEKGLKIKTTKKTWFIY